MPSTPRPGEGWFIPPSALDAILSCESLGMHLQPIVSLKKKSVIGVEALTRAWVPDSGDEVAPLQLFRWAAAERRSLELDRLCRSRALEAFAPLVASDPNPPLLFLNFEASILDEGVEGSGILTQAVRDSGLHPGDIVIEVNESGVEDTDALRRFVENHRRQGFLIALDDLGAGFSNLQRLSILKPEIIKVDRSIIAELDSHTEQRKLFRSLVVLGHGVGALVLAEGVENEAEMSICAELGADLIQGFFIGLPSPPDLRAFGEIESQLAVLSARQQERAVVQLTERRLEAERNWRLLDGLAAQAGQVAAEDFDSVFRRLIAELPGVECLFVLDTQGCQVTETVESPALRDVRRSRLFHPASRQTDHSFKDYFYSITGGGLPRYATEPYLSMATGLPCYTLSCPFIDSTGAPYILCLDLSTT